MSFLTKSVKDIFTRKVAPDRDPLSIGNLAMSEGMITKQQLLRALEASKTMSVPLGEALVQLNMVSPADRDNLMRMQLRLRDRSTIERAHYELEAQKSVLEHFNKGVAEFRNKLNKLKSNG